MKKLVLFGLVIALLGPGCSEDDSGLCGNNSIDPGETCDGDCPQNCDDQNSCTIDTIYGRADNCDVECRHEALTGCFDGDGCCPQGCTSAEDDDCGGGQVDCQFDPGVNWHIVGEILQMESADLSTCVWLSRTNLCPAGMICKSIPFSLDEVRIGHDGQVHEYDSNNATLTWTPIWHNWEDSGTIDTGTTVYTLTASSYGHAYEITASGGETWGPILLEPWEP